MSAETLPARPDFEARETTVNPERYRVNFNVLTISGDPATGTTTVGRSLSEILNIRHINAGDIVKRLHNVGPEEEIGYIERTPDEDLTIDKMIVEEIADSKYEDPSIIEARLSGYFGTLTNILTNDSLEMKRILLTASPFERALRRQNTNPELAIEDIMENQRIRKEKDLEEFKQVHPELSEIDDPMTEDAELHKRWLYDIIIHTDGLSIEEVVQAILDELEVKGDIEKLSA